MLARIENAVPVTLRGYLRHAYLGLRQARLASVRDCPVCGFHGRFLPSGAPIRPEAMCPSCHSLERQRLVKLWSRGKEDLWRGKRILHFAPETSIRQIFQPLASHYLTADVTPGRADRVLNAEHIALDDASYDVIICFHVLEHVDDAKALAELYRILAPGGTALLMVPIIEGWEQTYQNDAISSPAARQLHYGQFDHLRWYGRDFRSRVTSAGFVLGEYFADGEETVRYSLLPGERLFIASKPRA